MIIGPFQEGGGVSKEIGGSLLIASVTSRFGWMIFKMAPKIFEEGAVKNEDFSMDIPLNLLTFANNEVLYVM